MEGIIRGDIKRMNSKKGWGAAHEDRKSILKTTSRLQANMSSWDEGDITHFYQDLLVMFQELRDDEVALTRKQMRIVENAWTSFDKIFNCKKDDPYKIKDEGYWMGNDC